jgi:hypothetical protein
MNKASVSAHDRWRDVLTRLAGSGLSVAQFCRRERLAVSTCFAWKRRLAREARTAALAFVRVRPASVPLVSGTADAPASSIELHLGQGRRLLLRPGFDPRTLAAALAVLEGSDARPEGR